MMSDATSFASEASNEGLGGAITFSLEIRGGRTGFRRRPILGERFLIGSDPVCDLRLDGRLAAPLHCLLHRSGNELEAELLCGGEMTVNGRAVESARLIAGDTLGVGGVRLIVHSIAVRFDIVRPTDDFDEEHANAAIPSEQRASGRTATRLVELIEDEQDRIRDFQDRRSAGAAALLEAVRRSKRPSSGAVAEEATTRSLADLAARLDQLARSVEGRSHTKLVAHLGRDAAAARQELLGQIDQLKRLAIAVGEASGRHSERAA